MSDGWLDAESESSAFNCMAAAEGDFHVGSDLRRASGRSKLPVGFGPDMFVPRLVGDAMAAFFFAGDLTDVDPDVSAELGRFVAMWHGQSRTTLAKWIVEEDGRQVLRAQDSGVLDRSLDTETGTSFLGAAMFYGREV